MQVKVLILSFRTLVIALVLGLLLIQPVLAQAGTPPTLQDGGQPLSENTRSAAIRELMATLQPSGDSSGGDMEALRMRLGEDGYVQSLGAPASQTFAVNTKSSSDPVSIAKGFLMDHGNIFGIASESVDFLTLKTSIAESRQYVRLQQTYAGIPVFGGEVIVQMNATGIESILCDIMTDTKTFDTKERSISPTIDVSYAQKAAIALLQSLSVDSVELQASEPSLLIYDPSIMGSSGSIRLVWKTTITDGEEANVAEVVLVDANNSEIANHYSLIFSHREIYDANNVANTWGTLVRQEGGNPVNNEVDTNYDIIGDTVTFYTNNHNRTHINGTDVIRSTVRYAVTTGQQYLGAFWNGNAERMAFGDGMGADDVVAHEYTHGVTQHESGLNSENEAGAINESFSDIWGEFVDLTNSRGTDTSGVRWQLGEDSAGGVVRYMADPPSSDDPDRRNSSLWDSNGEVHTNSGVGNKLAYLLTDGDTFNGFTITGLTIPVVADLFYEVQTNLLTSDADYHDLGDQLMQAAQNLGWSASDKYNLEKACLAVEILDFTGEPSVAFDTSGNVKEMYVIAETTGNMWYRYWTGSSFSSWDIYGHPTSYGFTGGCSVAFNTSGTVKGIGAVSADGNLYLNTYSSGYWSGWQSFSHPTGSNFTGGCSLAFNTSGTVKEIYAVAENGNLYCKYDDNGWSGWNSYSHPYYIFTGGVSVAFDTSGNVQEMYAVAADGNLYNKYWDSGWSSWNSYGHPGIIYDFTGGPSVAFNTSGNVQEMYCVANDGTLWCNYWDNGWSDWSSYGHPENPDRDFTGGCSVAFDTSGNVQEMYSVAEDGTLWCKYYDSGWSNWIRRGES